MDHGRPTSAGHAAMPAGAKDLADLVGQPVARRAAEICAVGATNLMPLRAARLWEPDARVIAPIGVALWLPNAAALRS
jgi:hypothetical protein